LPFSNPSEMTGNNTVNIDVAVHDLVGKWVGKQPDAAAVHDSATGAEITYRELWRRSGILGSTLIEKGVRPGDLVVVALDRSIDLVVALLGIVRAGGAYVPLDSYAPADRLRVIVEEAGTGLAVVGDDPERWGLPAEIRRVAVPGPEYNTGAPVPAPAPAPTPAPASGRAAGADPIYVAYTSGSTGRPKGVVVPHRAVVRLVTADYCPISPADRVANASNPAFDATTFEIWSALTAGATVVVFPAVTELSIDRWVELVARARITVMFLTTSLFHMVARERPDAFRTVRHVIAGGEQLELGAARRVLAADGPPGRLGNGYGPTETTTFASYFECTPDSLDGLDRVPIGYPLRNTILHVLDADLRPVVAGEPGELCIGGPGVATGYLRRPELTAEKFVQVGAERLYRTGDVVRELPGGALELLGRRDRQVKLRGFRIELEEIERATVATGLVDVAYVEKVGAGPAAALVAFVLPAPGADRTPDLPAALTAALGDRVPAYMVPARWVVLDRLPTGATGKTDRAALLALLADGSDPTGPDAAPGADPIEAHIGQICRELLPLGAVRPTDNFLALGGNSILAIQVASRIRERLMVDVEPADVLLADSLADLAVQVRKGSSNAVA
jgi:amino acid adenylation domain-containing protein